MASKPKVTPQKKGQKPKVQLPKNCGICNATFGLFLGRHQCSKCKMILCAHCSVRKTRKDPRVCNRCKPAEVSKGAKQAPKNWKCQTCSFENELEHGACFACNSPRPVQGTFHVGAKVNSTFRDKSEGAIIKSENSDGTFNIVFESDYAIALHVPKDKLESVLKGQATILQSDIAAITAEIEATKRKIAEAAKAKESKEDKAKAAAATWWCAYCTFENVAKEPKCTMCKQEKPAFSYPFYACGGCTLVNPLGAATCELCGTKKPAPGPKLMHAQEAAKNADSILVRDTQQTPVSPTQAPSKKKPGEATLLAGDIEQIQKQIEAAKKFLADAQSSKDSSDSKEKEEAAEKALATVTETVSNTIAEAEEGDTVPELVGAGTVSSPSVTPVKKKKKGVTFGFSKEEPKAGSRLAYARAQTLAIKKNKNLGGPAKGNKFAITVRSEWLEAEMNVKKMMTEWDDLNKKAKLVAEETKGDEKVPETPEPTPETSTPTPTPETPTSSTSTTPTSSEIGEEHVDAESKHDELFQKLQEEFKSITVEEKEKEKKEAEEAEKASTLSVPETTTTTETPSTPSTETPASPTQSVDEKDMTVERELLLYLENNKDRYKAFSAHSQEYAQGKLTAFMYYYLIGKTFGDGLVPIVLPLVLRALEGNPKKQEALKCYHQFAMSKSCGLCHKMVYLPEEIRAADKSWHRWCFKCQGTGCTITLDLRSFFAKGGNIYCKKHVPS